MICSWRMVGVAHSNHWVRLRAMTFWIVFIAAATITLVAIYLAQRQPGDRDQMGLDARQGPRYVQHRPLTDPEQVLYWRLVEALPECVVLAQVSFTRFMKAAPEGNFSPAQQLTLYRRISQKTIDYLVCLKDFTVVAAVELDDASHDEERDSQRDALLKSAGIVPLRIDVKHI